VARFLEYAASVVRYWQFWIAVAFWGERALERFLPRYAKKLDPYLPPDGRRVLFIWIAIIAFVYANFRVWDDERVAKENAILSAQAPKLNPFKIYQDGFEIGDVAEPKIDPQANTLVFPSLTTIRLDGNKEIEYSNWKILCSLRDKDLTSISGTPAGPTRMYQNVQCRIEGHR
jgi:hypothetical protein